MKELSPEQILLIKKPLPPEAVKPHPTKTYLSSIKAIYVVERLNEVFGIGKWHLRSEIVDNKTAHIVVKTILTVPEYGIELESYGGNDNGGEGSKGHDLGDAYKGAVTDATTKICSYIGIGMDVFKGLAGKTQGAPQGQPGQQPSKQDDGKAWLNEGTEAYAKALESVKSGAFTVAQIKTKYKLAKATEDKLKAAAAQPA